MDIERTLVRGLGFFGTALRHVGDDQWANPTPCAEWDVRQLTGHVIGVMGIAVRVLRGAELGGSLAPAEVTAPLAEWQDAAAEVRRELAGADLTATRSTVLGARPLSFSLAFPALDLYLHAWDVGRATGQDVRIPDDVAEWIEGFLRGLPPERMRGPHTFGPEREAPPDADRTTRLMAFTGRAV